jgi:hypothetical protein
MIPPSGDGRLQPWRHAMSGRAELGNLWHTIQAWLFPMLEDGLGELDDRHREFIAVCETCAPFEHLAAYRWVGNGWIAQGPPVAVQGVYRQGRVGLPHHP